MAGMLPGNGTQTAGLILGLVGLSSTAGLIIRLWQARSSGTLSRRWPVMLSLIFACYAGQAALSFVTSTTAQSHSQAAVYVFILFGVGIARSLGTARAARRRAARPPGLRCRQGRVGACIGQRRGQAQHGI